MTARRYFETRLQMAQPIEGFTTARAQSHYPPNLELEPVHLDIALRLELKERQCTGTVTLHLQARHATETELALHAVDFEDLEVSDPSGEEIWWNYDGSKLRVRWSLPWAKGEQRRVAVRYRVVDPPSGLLFSFPDEAYPNAPRFAVTDHETERARHWLPCIDQPNARTTLDFHLRAPSDLTILANGARVGQDDHDDQTKTVH